MDNTPDPLFSRVKTALSILGVLTVGLVFNSLLGEFHPLLEGFSYFLFHYGLLCAILVPALWLLKGNRWLIASLIMSGIVCLLEVQPFPIGAPPSPTSPVSASSGQTSCLTLTHFNLWVFNPNPQESLGFLNRQTSPVVNLLEVNEEWYARFQGSPMWARYPHKLFRPEAGILVLSQYPMEEIPIPTLTNRRIIPLQLTVGTGTSPETSQSTVRLITTHAPTPLPHRLSTHHTHLADLAQTIPQVPWPVVAVGDLNTTPWSATFKQVLNQSGLRDSRAGFGNQASWPSFMGPLGIPIDHVMVSPDVEVRERDVYGNWSSDHQPVITQVCWANSTGGK